MSRSSESVVKGVEQASDSTPLEPSGPPKTTLGETLRCEWKSRFGESTEKPLVSSQCATCHTMEPPSTARLLAPSLQPLVPLFLLPPSWDQSRHWFLSSFNSFFRCSWDDTFSTDPFWLCSRLSFYMVAAEPAITTRRSAHSRTDHSETDSLPTVTVRPTHSQQDQSQ